MFQRFFKSEKSRRALPDQSARELADAKTRLGVELSAALYLYKEEKFIICAIAGIAEYGTPIVLNSDAADEELGLAVCETLLEFKPQSPRDLSNAKLEDWGAFKASGAKTGKSFEKESIYVYVKTANSAIQIEAAPRITNNKCLKALCSISNGREHSEIGESVRKAIEASKVLRNAGLL